MKYPLRFLALFILFSAMNFLWFLADSTYAGNNGPTYLADQSEPFYCLTIILQPWQLLDYPALFKIASIIGINPFNTLAITDNVSFLSVSILSAVSVVAYLLIWLLFRRVSMVTKYISRVPRGLPWALYLLLLTAYISMAINVLVGIKRFIPPAIPD